MKNDRTEEEVKKAFTDIYDTKGSSDKSNDRAFKIFRQGVRWADSHPTKSVNSWMDEVTLLHKEIRKLKEQLKNKNNEKTN